MKLNSDSHLLPTHEVSRGVQTGVPWPKQRPHIYIGGGNWEPEDWSSGSSSIVLSRVASGHVTLAYWPRFRCIMETLALPYLC